MRVPISELDEMPGLPFAVPEINPDQMESIISFCGGPYKYRQGMNYITSLRKMELEEQRKEGTAFDCVQDYFYEAAQFPQNLLLHIRHIKDPGDYWR